MTEYGPREKLKNMGVESLEDHELLSIVFGKGNSKESVFNISKRIFKGFAKDDFLNERNLNELQDRLKLGFVHSCQLMACIELGKRFFSESIVNKRIQSLQDAYLIFENMQYLSKEHMKGIYLNTRYKVIHEEVITIGSLDANIIHPREVFRPAIESGAYALLVAHNHPSGDNTPSDSDIEVTKKLKAAGELLQIPLLDHLVIGKGSFTSIYGVMNV